MKKIGLFLMALAAVAVLGAAVYAAENPAPKAAAPAKKAAVKLLIAKGEITAVDEAAGTFTLNDEKAGTMTFKVGVKLAKKITKKIKVGEKVEVAYKTLPSGENHAVYVKKERTKKAAPKK